MRLDIGNIHAADHILPFFMMIAPSWRGVFLKKMFSMRDDDNAASIISPVSAYALSSCWSVITSNAPVLLLDKFEQALRMESTCFCAFC